MLYVVVYYVFVPMKQVSSLTGQMHCQTLKNAYVKVELKTLWLCQKITSHVIATLSPLISQVWSVSDGTQLEEYLLHSDHVNCVLYSPTQPHILSAADNGIVKVRKCFSCHSVQVSPFFIYSFARLPDFLGTMALAFIPIWPE